MGRQFVKFYFRNSYVVDNQKKKNTFNLFLLVLKSQITYGFELVATLEIPDEIAKNFNYLINYI